MVKTTVNVEGMACGMCEAHINDAVRKVFNVKKVTSSHKKKTTVILSDQPLDSERLKKTIADAGYIAAEIHPEPYDKKAFSLLKK